jgi:hypothetical protein
MEFGVCWNHHFLHRPCKLRFGLKSGMVKNGQMHPHGDFEIYTTNEHEESFYSSHMIIGRCMCCQNRWHWLLCGNTIFTPHLKLPFFTYNVDLVNHTLKHGLRIIYKLNHLHNHNRKLHLPRLDLKLIKFSQKLKNSSRANWIETLSFLHQIV